MEADDDTVFLVREFMDGLPPAPVFELPFAVRSFTPGDEMHWRNLQSQVERREIGEEVFTQEFARAPAEELSQCIFFVGVSGRTEPVACIAAWRVEVGGTLWGLMHSLAVLPEFEGLGLGRRLVALSLRRLAEFGYRRCIIQTDAHRLGAIKLFLEVGFLPDLSATEDAASRWGEVSRKLPHPVLLAYSRTVLGVGL
eukprot:RCo009654